MAGPGSPVKEENNGPAMRFLHHQLPDNIGKENNVGADVNGEGIANNSLIFIAVTVVS